MRKNLLLLFILWSSLNADTVNSMYNLFQKGSFLEACNIGLQNFQQNQSNEAYVSLYAFSCLKADQIDRLNTPIMVLNQSAEARANASYFTMLVLQKKLLLQALYDNKPIGTLKLPTSSHLLSKIFDRYSKEPQPSNPIKEYTDKENPRFVYKLYTTRMNGRNTFAIDEYYDRILSVHHVY